MAIYYTNRKIKCSHNKDGFQSGNINDGQVMIVIMPTVIGKLVYCWLYDERTKQND
jgi:hypothetical protein